MNTEILKKKFAGLLKLKMENFASCKLKTLIMYHFTNILCFKLQRNYIFLKLQF